MQNLREQIVRAAAFDVSVLLQGESGTGKELIARLLHRLSRRADGPFIGVNCAAIHESLLESELFGHEAGAFTGAKSATVGFLRAADGGTILLDEVGDMSSPLQSKLLRVLEERAVVPVGGTKAIPVNIRVVSATHRDLARAVHEGSFRADLYYRFNVVCLSVPPLRERREDIPVLVKHLTERIGQALKVEPKGVSPAALDAMVAYGWPGNVRELANVIQRAYVLSENYMIEVQDLPTELFAFDPADPFPTLREATGRHIAATLQLAGGVRSKAAETLGVDRKTLWRMMRRCKVEYPPPETIGAAP